DAGKICLAAYACAKAAVESVIPDVQFPNRRGIDGRNEINRIVRHVYYVLVSSDAIELWHIVVWQCIGLDFQSPSAVSDSDDRPLRLCPLYNGQIPRRPSFNRLRSRIVLIFES